MGRRSFGISSTMIKRMVSASISMQKAKERQNLIESQRGIATEMKPTYQIKDFDFNESTRVSHICFLETKQRRKIVRYITQNGIRYPIYGDWVPKTKDIKKVIKLTNQALEDLQKNNDDLISKFSYEIVSRLGREEYFPSWFIICTLSNEKEFETNETKRKHESLIGIKKSIIKSNDKTISENNNQLELLSQKKNKLIKKHNKNAKLINSAQNKKFLVLFSIITLGIYYAFHSKPYIESLFKKNNKVEDGITKNANSIASLEQKNHNLEKENTNLNSDIKDITKTMEEEVKTINETYNEKISHVEPLPTDISAKTDKEFIPLKKLAWMNYEKIVGCYVIRNKENGRCYVGQSKDVLKRVCKQHFEGTKVKNIIFAEDYYQTKFENKDDLFEVRIIRLNTKDELDKKEKELIEEYDAFGAGYNGTSGNS